ncbi:MULTISPECIES: ANTAR domain-containing response regulator [Methylocaldum]|jgi:response regulator NasT|uniref:ANTAR domain-containing response regulator n=1 Tax=unclassified Methylocaldum TaxID=2622260 RepID=UPI00098A1A6E|nr:ANTAR domain-containing protein [Methylocaldum sp. 14B]MDV3243407.1 ANTAR domain-containing protein [Methylocaldum sp.]MVF23622.1 ANTAR domain-containing protein [Methylocaldum sp. BRCS4]
MSLRIMLVDQDSARSAILEQALHDAGHQVVARIKHGHNLLRELKECQPDMVIMDLEAPGRDTLEQMREISRDQPRPIILFSNKRDGDYIRQAVQAGVSAYVVDGLSQERIMPIVEVAMARFREFEALKRELHETKTQLADRKVVDKAKGILMQRKGMSEDEAYQLLRKTAMSRNMRIADVARTLLTLEGLTD